MPADDHPAELTAELRRIRAERAIGEGRKRHQLVVGELFPDGDVVAQWVFSLTALVEDLSVLTRALKRAREEEDLRAFLFGYRQLVTRLYEARRLATAARTVPAIAAFIGDLLRRPPGGIDLERAYLRDPETKESTVEHLYAGLRHRTVHYLQPGSQELADMLWEHSGYPAQIAIESNDGGQRSIWFQWIHAVTASDVFGDVHEVDFLENMNKRSEYAGAIAMSWIAAAAVTVILHIHRLGIDSSRLGDWPETSAQCD
jgi:hypothetical protein